MVARINTIAFSGVDVQSIDLQISNGFPAFTIVGYILLALLFLIPIPASASEACPLFGAEYVPQDQKYDPDNQIVNRKLTFILRIEEGDMNGPMRTIFLSFDAYDNNNRKVSTMRFGNASSNGISKEGFHNFFGRYCDYNKSDEESGCLPAKGARFDIIGINDDLTPADIRSVPPLLIFPNTYSELKTNSYDLPEEWDAYIKFYTAERTYPDFRFYDFWVRKKCGLKVRENE